MSKLVMVKSGCTVKIIHDNHTQINLLIIIIIIFYFDNNKHPSAMKGKVFHK